MEQIPLPPASHILVASLLRAARNEDHDEVIQLGQTLLLDRLSELESSSLWLVQLNVCTAAHALDDYTLMDNTARQMLTTAINSGRADYEIEALLRISTALRCLGRPTEAVGYARRAQAKSSGLGPESALLVKVYQVLMAALVEAARPDEAWDLHRDLDSSLHLVEDLHEQGKAYWTLGNLAFLFAETSLALHYHDRAIELLSPTDDMLLWARFNRASTELRLQAGLVGTKTRDCLARAEIAFGLIDAGDLDCTGLAITRSRYAALTDGPQAGMAILDEFVATYRGGNEPLSALYDWWAELLEQDGSPGLANAKRQRAIQLGNRGPR